MAKHLSIETCQKIQDVIDDMKKIKRPTFFNRLNYFTQKDLQKDLLARLDSIASKWIDIFESDELAQEKSKFTTTHFTSLLTRLPRKFLPTEGVLAGQDKKDERIKQELLNNYVKTDLPRIRGKLEREFRDDLEAAFGNSPEP